MEIIWKTVRFFCGLLLLASLFSCEYFKKAEDPEAIANKVLQEIDWNAVDTYPLFDHCEELAEKPAQKRCFVETVRNTLDQQLKKQLFVVADGTNEAINVAFEVDTLGNIQITGIQSSSALRAQLPTLDSLLHQSLDSLPRLFPALKRNQPVATIFSVDIAVNPSP